MFFQNLSMGRSLSIVGKEGRCSQEVAVLEASPLHECVYVCVYIYIYIYTYIYIERERERDVMSV